MWSDLEIEKALRKGGHPKYMMMEDEKYLSWIQTLPCLICFLPGGSDPHHVWHTGGGGGKKMDYMAVPLCRKHHRAYHDLEHKIFEETYNTDLTLEIIRLLSLYLQKGELNERPY